MTGNVPRSANSTVRSAVKTLIRYFGINNESAYFGRDKDFKLIDPVILQKYTQAMGDL